MRPTFEASLCAEDLPQAKSRRVEAPQDEVLSQYHHRLILRNARQERVSIDAAAFLL